MNIIERITDTLKAFPKIDRFSVHTDFADISPTGYGLTSIGDTKLSEDVMGNELRRHSFLLYAVYSGINDYERMANTGLLTELAIWLERQTGAGVTTVIGDESFEGEVQNITTGNGLIYELMQNNHLAGIRYQLQITADYTINY
ncbi:MAG: hypothetical protein IJ740_08205 [Ruminococcus sp.]|nr:hypothetical protein [Ruminococcus sp.]